MIQAIECIDKKRLFLIHYVAEPVPKYDSGVFDGQQLSEDGQFMLRQNCIQSIELHIINSETCTAQVIRLTFTDLNELMKTITAISEEPVPPLPYGAVEIF